jgi:hypothetical protein
MTNQPKLRHRGTAREQDETQTAAPETTARRHRRNVLVDPQTCIGLALVGPVERRRLRRAGEWRRRRAHFQGAGRARGSPLGWASGQNGDIKRAAYGYEPTREDAMKAFAKSWRTRLL